jgi:hypothetical protein
MPDDRPQGDPQGSPETPRTTPTPLTTDTPPDTDQPPSQPAPEPPPADTPPAQPADDLAGKTADEIEAGHTRAELADIAEARGLDTRGNKGELAARIAESAHTAPTTEPGRGPFDVPGALASQAIQPALPESGFTTPDLGDPADPADVPGARSGYPVHGLAALPPARVPPDVPATLSSNTPPKVIQTLADIAPKEPHWVLSRPIDDRMAVLEEEHRRMGSR